MVVLNLDEYETMKTQLSLVKRGLNKINVPWAIFAGAAAHCYGSKRQLADIDILVENDNFDMAKAVVKEAGTEKIDVIAKLKIETCQGSYFFFVDDEMIKEFGGNIFLISLSLHLSRRQHCFQSNRSKRRRPRQA